RVSSSSSCCTASYILTSPPLRQRRPSPSVKMAAYFDYYSPHTATHRLVVLPSCRTSPSAAAIATNI
ncbi:hypothetical protein A2U01_0085711, partial [Trifolium medium]|nr:hypothetical protein [Trifolium medium]